LVFRAKVKSESSNSNCCLFAKFKIILQFAVVIGQTACRVAQPEMDEVLGNAIPSEVCNAETAKSVTTTRRLIEILPESDEEPGDGHLIGRMA